ncbi:hypothetical protein ABZ356_10045 [Micromonospora zamorensis]|uniref:hypothetical protein n=1 Tax=Micromonospora zamorensis TaxID=709883 RepID=UPI003411BC72
MRGRDGGGAALPDLTQVVGYLNSGHVLIDVMDYVVPSRGVPELTACYRQARDLMFWNS